MKTRLELIAELGLSLNLQFIPLQNADKLKFSELSFNYEATLIRNGNPVLTTPYQTGIGWVNGIDWPHSSLKVFHVEIARKLAVYGKIEPTDLARYPGISRVSIIQPTIEDILHSLLLDGSALDECFEDWCANYGFDADSRKAYAIWEKCCGIGRKINSGIGRNNVEKLLDAFQDY